MSLVSTSAFVLRLDPLSERDLVVAMDGVSLDGDRAVYRWTLTGSNTGPGGTGRPVRISGREEWTFGRDGLIAESQGHFDEADYNRQLGE